MALLEPTEACSAIQFYRFHSHLSIVVSVVRSCGIDMELQPRKSTTSVDHYDPSFVFARKRESVRRKLLTVIRLCGEDSNFEPPN